MSEQAPQTNTVPVIDTQTGQLTSVMPHDLDQALQTGFRTPTPEELHDFELKQKYGEGVGNELKAGLAGAARGATFGLSDQLLTHTGAVNPETLSALQKYNPTSSGVGEIAGVVLPAVLSGGTSVEAGAAAEASLGSKVLGAVSAPVKAVSELGTGISEAVAPAAEKLVGLGVNPETSPIVSKILSSGLAHGAGSAVEGAAYGLGQSVSENALGDPDLTAEKILSNVGFGAILGGGIGGVIGGAGPAMSAIKNGLSDASVPGVIKKGLSILGGVPEKDIDAYLANREAVNSAPEFQEIYEHSLNHVENVLKQVDESKLSLDEATQSFKEIERSMKDDLRTKGYDAAQSHRMAKQALKDAQIKLVSDIQDKALNKASHVTSAVENLRERVIDQSSKSYQILEQSDQHIVLDNFLNKGKELIDELRSEGTLEALNSAKRVQEYLNNVKAQARHAANDGLSEAPNLTGRGDFFDFDPTPNAKKADSTAVVNRQKFGKQDGQSENLDYVSTKHLKYALDHDGINPDTGYEINVEEARKVLARRAEKNGEEELKQYIRDQKDGKGLAFEETPEEIAIAPKNAKKLIQGLDKVSKYDFNATSFDKDMSKAYKRLRWALDDSLKETIPEYREAMKPLAEDTKLLKNLDKYGTEESATRRIKSLKNADTYKNEMPFLKELEQKTGIKLLDDIEQYANPKVRAKLIKSLPEFEEASKAASELETLRNPRTIQRLNEELVKHPEYTKAQAAKSIYDSAKAEKDALGGLTPVNLESKLKSVLSGRNINNSKLVSAIPEMHGKSVKDLLELSRLNGVFQKGAMNGSRNVNLFTGVLGGLGGALGGHVFAGAGIGAGVGGVVDKYGPAITKRLLDMHVEHLSKLERTAQKTAKSISSAAKNIFSSVKPGVIAAASEPVLASGGKQDEHINNISDLAQNPDKLMKKLEEVTANIHQAAPNTSASLQASIAKATMFLETKIPKNPNHKPFSPKFVPSKAEISKFNRYYNTVKNPVSVLHGIKTGMIMPEQMETLVVVYPKLLAKMQAEVMDHMTTFIAKNDVSKMPMKTRMALSMFLGQDLDPSLDQAAILSNQMMMSGQQNSDDQLAKPVQPTQGGMKNLSLSNRSLTDMQAVTQGGNA